MVRTRDGRALHVERFGEGTPTVVFESGLGISRNQWGAVAPKVAERTAVVVYDRANIGRSDPDPAPRDLARLTDDLVDLLGQVEGPVVLVGHSWGGPIVRCAAAALPDRVAGLVLVDVSDERCDLFFDKGNRRQLRWAPALLPLTQRLGLVQRMVAKLATDLPEPWATGLRTEDATAAATRAQLAELASTIDDLRRLRDHPPALPDVPVTLITGTVVGPMEKARRPALVEAHAASAAALPQGRHVLATRSSHYVPLTEPDLVVAEVGRLLSRGRTRE
jgi:pimeloyl-ACP methyl ester carboxylesterase